MNFKKTIVMGLVSLFAAAAVAGVAGCTTKPLTPKTDYNVSSDTLYVKKVENLCDDFVMGMDASCVPALEKSGVKYYDFDGTEKDVYQILADNGVNTIRVRVWNDPFDKNGNGYGGGNCDIDNAIEIGKRANKYGMNLMLDFHYSDFWADPSKQMVPKAWKDLKIDAKAEALKKYTEDCLDKINKNKIAVNIVQIGNETNGYFCGEKMWNAMAKLFSAGAEAVRDKLPKAQIALHFANPEKVTNYKEYASKLKDYYVDYDIFASSYYPYWHGTLDNLKTLLSSIATDYGKRVMVAETSYAFTGEDTDFSGNTIGESGNKRYPYTVQGQSTNLQDVIETVAATTNGMGVCYWEGTWITVGTSSWDENHALWEKYGSGWASSYSAEYDPNDAGQYYGGSAVDNQAFFDKNGKVLESLKTFALVRKGNEVQVKPDALEEVSMLCVLGKEIKLPEKVNAVMNDNSKKQVNVTWESIDKDAIQAAGVKKYDIKGTANGLTTVLHLSMIEPNFLKNNSFEDSENKDKIPANWKVTEVKKSSELYVEDKTDNSQTGDKNFHFWSGGANQVEFYLEQTIEGIQAGSYNVSFSIMGSDGGDVEIYSYVKIGTEIVAKSNKVGLDGYQEWREAKISNYAYDGNGEFTVGIYVKATGANAWGNVDDGILSEAS